MNRIDERFLKLRGAGLPAFIPFLAAGDPDLETTGRLLRVCEECGADAIELGFPYSDPIADGPTIQEAFVRALGRGVRLEEIFRTVERARREGTSIPIVAMLSYSLVYRMGLEGFVRRAAKAGLDGATVPDLPVEEAEELERIARKQDFHLIYLVAPTTDEARRKRILKRAGGFIYYVSVRGITGVRSGIAEDLAEKIAGLRAEAKAPVAVGFGIGSAEQAAAVAHLADGVIVGSAIVKLVAEKAKEGSDAVVKAVGALVRELSAATKSVGGG
ncbi:MAG: tryptophan synthase subunit alpha [Planctomycetota bacterium]